MQKLELFQNIERLREYGINVVYNDYKKINPGTTNTNLFTAYKNILKTDTAAANNFNLTPLDQSIDANMVSYIVKII